jgi:hypothetical protein
MNDFTFTDVERIIPHAKRSTVQMWINSGLIIPKENKAGRGLSRRYSFENLIEIWAAVELSLVWGMSTFCLRYIFQLPSFRDAVKNKTRCYSVCHDRDGIGTGWMTSTGTGNIPDSETFTSAIQLDFSAIAREIQKRI